ncbi:hypothetical protein LEP1GSC170_2054 [Leptospira interrogans serovar Bataviae str. HAI135]|nr:hypothetical protein LEP1GSC170_2054 [Leptospira interrogans serovar Bataviae str. HAI135]
MNVDTIVQEKAITFPTDAKLYHKNLSSPVFSYEKPTTSFKDNPKFVR